VARNKSATDLHSTESVEIVDSVGPQQYQFNPLNAEQRAVLCAALSSSGTGKPYRVQCNIQYSGVGRPVSDKFSTRSIIGDGNCYFRCLSYALTGSENTHHRDLRQRVAQFERQNQTSIQAHVWTGDTVEGHISRVSVVGSYARETDILSSAAMLNVNISM